MRISAALLAAGLASAASESMSMGMGMGMGMGTSMSMPMTSRRAMSTGRGGDRDQVSGTATSARRGANELVSPTRSGSMPTMTPMKGGAEVIAPGLAVVLAAAAFAA